jgi:hypothetical protein
MGGIQMNKHKILAAATAELSRHVWDYFCTEPKSVAEGGSGVIVPGCSHCKKRVNTTSQYIEHLANDVLPKILREAFKIAAETSANANP